MSKTATVTAAQRRVRLLRVGWLLGALVASAGAAAVAASFLLTAAVLNSDLAEQIRRATGSSTAIHGSARLALFPQPHVEIENISFANPQAALRVDAARFTGYFRLLPLLAGRVEIGHIILYRPKMVIDLDDRPMTPESAIGRAAAAKSSSPEAAAIDTAKLGIVDLVGGSARLERHAAPHDLLVDDIDIRIDWRSLDASATLTGQFNFRGVPLQLKAWFAQPVELLRGGQSAAILHLDSDALRLLASGRISAAPAFQYEGSLLASAPSFRRIARLAGYAFAKHGRFADLDLRCDANVSANTAALTNLHLRLDGNEYEGALAVQSDGQTPRLSGTLATNLLDLTPFLEGLPQPSGDYRRWNNEPLELADFGFTNLDLRLSASRVRLGDIKISDAAVSVLTRPGSIDLALAEAVANGGAIRGHLTLSAAGKMLEFRASGSAAGVDVGPMLQGRNVKHPLLGSLSGSLALESSGSSFDQLMHELSGHAQASVASGQVVGIDLATALRSGAQQPFAGANGAAQSVTNFDAATFGLRINKGIAEIIDGRIHADGMAISFGGTAGLGDRNLDLWALARATGTAGQPAITARPLRLAIKGPWDDLHVVTDRPPPTGLPASPAQRHGGMPADKTAGMPPSSE